VYIQKEPVDQKANQKMARKKVAKEPTVEVQVATPPTTQAFEVLIDVGTIQRPKWDCRTWDGQVRIEGGVLILMRGDKVVDAFAQNAWKRLTQK